MIDTPSKADNQANKINSKEKEQSLLYKYLDINGAKCMLYYRNLQYTNALKLNDPFDCHPGLIDFSKITPEQAYPWGKEGTISLKINPYERYRERAWICCLSKVFDSILMWSYYNGHAGVCIGLDKKKIEDHLRSVNCTMADIGMNVGPFHDVVYRDIIKKPDFFAHNNVNFFYYQMLTKAKDWEHEQEVRMIILDPYPSHQYLLFEPEDENEEIHYKEIRTGLSLGGDCFAAIYLGVNIKPKDKETIIKLCNELNSDMRVYQMSVNPNAFKLDFELI